MSLAWAVVLGFVLGLRHATDADHVVAIGTLLHREASPARAARLARCAELAVAAMLVTLGAWTIRRVTRPAPHPPRWRPVLVGIVHGLGGSAGVALLALATVASRAGALAYLALFCAGTIAGMVALTVALSLPLRWSLRRYGAVPRLVVVAAGLMSVGFGVALTLQAVS